MWKKSKKWIVVFLVIGGLGLGEYYSFLNLESIGFSIVKLVELVFYLFLALFSGLFMAFAVWGHAIIFLYIIFAIIPAIVYAGMFKKHKEDYFGIRMIIFTYCSAALSVFGFCIWYGAYAVSAVNRHSNFLDGTLNWLFSLVGFVCVVLAILATAYFIHELTKDQNFKYEKLHSSLSSLKRMFFLSTILLVSITYPMAYISLSFYPETAKMIANFPLLLWDE